MSTMRRGLLPALFAVSAGAQSALPDLHWGANFYPAAKEELRLSLGFNRFTEFSKTSDPSNPTTTHRFNEIPFSAGFNIATLGWTTEFELFDRRWTGTFDLGSGPTRDQPTRFLQNEYIHKAMHQGRVPTGALREETEFLGGASARAWFGDAEPHEGHEKDPHHRVLTEGYAGLGFAASSLYHDSYAQVGGRLLFTDVLHQVHVELSASDRTSWLYPSDAFTDVAHFANIAQVGIAVVPADFASTSTGTFEEGWNRFWMVENLLPYRWPGLLYDLVGRPKIGVYATHDSGLFVDAQDSPIETWFASLRFEWATGLRIETYNDFANGTDFGPTFGLIVSWDLMTFAGSFLP